MSIREFQWPGDYDAVIALWQAVGLYRAHLDSREAIETVANRNPTLFLLATDNKDRLVGSIIGAFDGRRGYLYHVAVHPDAQRQGHGKELLQEVERRLFALGVDKILFTVDPGNAAAQTFYQSLGYLPDSQVLLMRKLRSEYESASAQTEP